MTPEEEVKRNFKNHLEKYSSDISTLADMFWAAGFKDESTKLHAIARSIRKIINDEAAA